MDAAQALSDLTEISSQIEAAIVLDAERLHARVHARRADAARSFATAVQELLAAVRRAPATATASRRRPRSRPATAACSSSGTSERTIAATTGPEPTVGLVFYDLKSCLRGVSATRPKPKPRPEARREKEESAMPRRKVLTGAVARRSARSPARSPSAAGSAKRTRAGRRLLRGRLDGLARRRLARGGDRAAARPPHPRDRPRQS